MFEKSQDSQSKYIVILFSKSQKSQKHSHLQVRLLLGKIVIYGFKSFLITESTYFVSGLNIIRQYWNINQSIHVSTSKKLVG